MLKLDLGSGPRRFDLSWTTVDVLATFAPEVHLDLAVDPWPWPDGSVDLAFANHLLEHLDEAGGRHFLGELRRVMRPGGWARIGVPDCRLAVDLYLKGRFWDVFAPQDKRSMLWDAATVLRGQFWNKTTGERDRWHCHRTPYDEETLRWLIRDCGWKEEPKIWRGEGQSAISEFRHRYFSAYCRGSFYAEIQRQKS